MKWYFKIGAVHSYVRVFVNGALCGKLCFRNEEFAAIRNVHDAIHGTLPVEPGAHLIQFFPEEVCPFQ